MVFDPFIAVRRFGAGPSPLYGAPTDAAVLLSEAAAPDPFAASHPFTTGAEAFATAQSYLEARGRARRRSGSEEGEAARQEMRALTQAARLREDGDLRALLVRHVGQPFGLAGVFGFAPFGIAPVWTEQGSRHSILQDCF